MPKTSQPCQIPEPEHFLKINSLWMSPNQERKLDEKFQCGAAFRPGPKRLTEALRTGHDGDHDGLGHRNCPKCSRENKDSPPKWPRTWRRGATESLRKHLCHSRTMVSAVKRGSSYFHLLQEQEEQRNEQRRKKEERSRCELRRPSASNPDSERETQEHRKSPWRRQSRRWGQKLRPFTPVHLSLICDQTQQLSEERAYHQLCCLCWLLESLTLEYSGKLGLAVSCWDSKDLGRGRPTLRAVRREKAIQAEWERFTSPTKCPIFRLTRTTPVRPSTQKSSSLSAMSSSLGNLSACDVTFSTEENECRSAAKSEKEPPVSKYLQMLLDEVRLSVRKELYGSQVDHSSDTNAVRDDSHTQDTAKVESHTPKGTSSPCERSCPSCSSLSVTKAAVLDEIKQLFEERTEELSQNLTDALDRSAKLRWSSEGQRHQSSSDGDTTQTPYSTRWLSALLSGLGARPSSSRKLQCVLEKLKRFADQRILCIRPHAFLRVLNSLPPWDLCCPDLCVAIEMVRENAVKLSADDYDCWLWSKVNHQPSR